MRLSTFRSSPSWSCAGNWSQLDAYQRNRFVAAYREWSTHHLTPLKFDGYDGDVFNTLDTKALPNGDQWCVHGSNRAAAIRFVSTMYAPQGRRLARANVISDGVSDCRCNPSNTPSCINEGLRRVESPGCRTKRARCAATAVQGSEFEKLGIAAEGLLTRECLPHLPGDERHACAKSSAIIWWRGSIAVWRRCLAHETPATFSGASRSAARAHRGTSTARRSVDSLAFA